MKIYLSNSTKPELPIIRIDEIRCGDTIDKVPNTMNIDEDSFYIEEDEKISIFLKGYCTAFAIALNKIFKYPVYKVNGGTHYYCKKVLNDSCFYIDVRGVTEDSDSFLSFFESSKNDEKIDENNSRYEDENIDIAIEYAEAFIKKYYDYYSVK